MADPFAIIQSGMLDIGKINSDYNLNRYRGLQAKVYARQAAQEDAAAARQAAAREAIGRGAKPDEVMAQDLDMGAKYADYVAKNGDQAHETAQRQAGAIVQIGTALKSVPRGPQRQGIWARALPVLKSVGVTDADLANFDPNDNNAIDAQVISHKALLKAGEDYTLGHARYSGATNTVIAREAEDPKWQEFDPTHTYVPLNGAASTFGRGEPQAWDEGQPGKIAAGFQGVPGFGGFHRIVAAEGGTNPDGSFRTSPKGAIGPAQLMPGTIPEAAQLAGVDPNLVTTDPRANLAAGEAYYNKQLSDFGDPALAAAAYNAGPGRVRDALQRGGPQGWIQHVPAETQAYVQKVVGGRSGGSAEGGATVGGAAGFPPGTIIGHPKPKDAPSGYRYNPDGSALEPIPGGPADPGGMGGAAMGDPNLHGDGFLATLKPNIASQVKALADGRLQFPSGFALKTPYWQQMLSSVAQYDPNFDAINYNARAKTRADFTSGKSAQNIKSLNTAIGHLSHLATQIPGTWSTGLTPLNSMLNAGQKATGGAGATNYEQTAGALASELTQVFRGSGGAEADVKRYLGELSSSASEEQKAAAISNIASLLQSRLEAVGDQYNNGMGKSTDPLTLLNPKARAFMGSLSGRGSQGGDHQSGGAKIPPGAVYVGTHQGRPVYKVNGRNWTP